MQTGQGRAEQSKAEQRGEGWSGIAAATSAGSGMAADNKKGMISLLSKRASATLSRKAVLVRLSSSKIEAIEPLRRIVDLSFVCR